MYSARLWINDDLHSGPVFLDLEGIVDFFEGKSVGEEQLGLDPPRADEFHRGPMVPGRGAMGAGNEAFLVVDDIAVEGNGPGPLLQSAEKIDPSPRFDHPDGLFLSLYGPASHDHHIHAFAVGQFGDGLSRIPIRREDVIIGPEPLGQFEPGFRALDENHPRCAHGLCELDHQASNRSCADDGHGIADMEAGEFEPVDAAGQRFGQGGRIEVQTVGYPAHRAPSQHERDQRHHLGEPARELVPDGQILGAAVRVSVLTGPAFPAWDISTHRDPVSNLEVGHVFPDRNDFSGHFVPHDARGLDPLVPEIKIPYIRAANGAGVYTHQS